MASSRSSHSRVLMFIRRVREALVTSVTWRRLPQRCQARKVSTVPKSASPDATAPAASGTLSMSQRSFRALKYSEMGNPVRRRTPFIPPKRDLKSSAIFVVRTSFQTMAL
eukprot:scaffold846_cov252-Pinguiococcus_pyrenoidosus.AAC.25